MSTKIALSFKEAVDLDLIEGILDKFKINIDYLENKVYIEGNE